MSSCKRKSSPLATGGGHEPAEIIGEDCRFLGFHVSAGLLRFLLEREVAGRRTSPFGHGRPAHLSAVGRRVKRP